MAQDFELRICAKTTALTSRNPGVLNHKVLEHAMSHSLNS